MTVRYLGGSERRRRWLTGLTPTFSQSFINGNNLPPGSTFTRNSTGWLYAQNGTLQPASSNSIPGSAGATWSTPGGTTRSASAVLGPDSTFSAYKYTETIGNSNHYTQSVGSGIYSGLTTGGPVTLSVYVLISGPRRFIINGTGAFGATANFDLSTGTVISVSGVAPNLSAAIVPVGNGWYRCSVTGTFNGVNSMPIWSLTPNTNSGTNITYVGDGTSSMTLYAPQCEASNVATTYVPNASAGVTYNQPRFDYDPSNVLQQNLFYYSNNFSNAYWTKINITVGITSALAPDGSNTATYLTNTNGLGSYVTQSSSIIYLPSTTYTRSFYAQLIVPGSGQIYSEIGGGVVGTATFNLASGTLGAIGGGGSATITPVGNGWYFCTHTFTTGATTSASTSSTNIYMNTYGVSTALQSIGLWNQQTNIGSTALPFLATSGSGQTVCAPKGLLIEESRTNSIVYSQDQTQAAWTPTNATLTNSTLYGPDGVTLLSLVTSTSLGGNRIQEAPTVLNATVYTFSAYMAAGSSNYGGLVCASTASAGAIYTLTGSGTVVSTVGTGVSATIQSVGNGLYRCTLTFTTTAAGSLLCGFGVSDGSTYGSVLYPSAGSGTISGGFCQLEAGAFATSYIPTTAAAVTRAADVCSAPVPPSFNTAQGTFVATFDIVNVQQAAPRVIGGLVGNTPIALNSAALVTFDGTLVIATPFVIPNTVTKAASSFLGTTLSITSGGVTPITGTGSLGFGNTTNFFFGSSNGAGSFLNGHIQSFQYFNYALTNAQLQQVTT